MPILIQQEQVVLAGVSAVQELVKVGAGHGNDQIARNLALDGVQLGGSPEERGAVSFAAVHLGKDQAVRLTGGIEDPPLGGQLGSDGLAVGGVAPDALLVVEVELGAGAAALGGAVKLTINHRAVRLALGQSGGHIGAGLQGQGSLAKTGIQAVQSVGHMAELGAGLFIGLGIHLDAENLQHHG